MDFKNLFVVVFVSVFVSMFFLHSSSAFLINGDLLKIEVLDDGKINFLYNNVDEIYQNDCGIAIKFFAGDQNKSYGHNGSEMSSLGSGFEVLSKDDNTGSITLKAGNLTINQRIIYACGMDFFTVEWSITNFADESVYSLSFFHGADMAVAGTDYFDDGIYNPNNKALYAKDSGYTVGLVPLPDFTPDEFEIDSYRNVWNHIIEGSLRNKTSYYGDTGIAFGWRKNELKQGESWNIRVNWKFNEDNEIPEINYGVNPRINFADENFNINANASEFVFWQIKIINESSTLFYFNFSGNNISLNWSYSETGNFTVGIIATDKAGNAKAVNESIKIITKQQLFLNVTNSLNNSITNNKTMVVEGITNAKNVSINGFFVSVSNGIFSLALNLTEGNNTLNVVAVDNFGNINTTTLNVILDTSILLILIEPLNNTITNNKTILIKGISEVNANVSINGNYIPSNNENFSFLFNLSEGDNNMNITSKDAIGNVNSTLLNIILDTGIPLNVILPENNSITNNRTILIKGITKSNANISVNENYFMAINGSFSFVLNLTEGDNSINILARDYLGNTNSTTLNVILDTCIPLTILGPLNNTITNNRTILIKGITKSNANISINENFTASVINGNFSFALTLTEESNNINITTRDYLGNINTTTLKVTLDTKAPEIKWINYSNSIKIYKTFRFALNITDNINLTYVSAKMMLGSITENLSVYFVNEYYVIDVEPTRTGDWILNVKACDGVGNCNESNHGFYAYLESSGDTTSTNPSTIPAVQPAIQNVTNETQEKETIVKILNNEGYTFGLAKFNTTENTSSYTPRNELWFINGTIRYSNNETFNGSVEIEFIGQTEIEGKNITFEVKNGNVNKEIEKTLENASSHAKESYVVSSEELNDHGNIIKIKENISKEIKENKTYETEIKDENGTLIKNATVEITLPDGEKIKVKTDEEGKVKLTTEDGKIVQIQNGNAELHEKIEEGKEYEVDIRDKEGNLIKDGIAEITLPDGEKIKVKTNKEGKATLMEKDGKIEQVNMASIKNPEVKNGTQNTEFKFDWYYFLPLLLIPLLLYHILKKDAILSYEYYKKLKEQNKLKKLKRYGKIHMLQKYDYEIKDLKHVIFDDADSEEELAKKINLKILK